MAASYKPVLLRSVLDAVDEKRLYRTPEALRLQPANPDKAGANFSAFGSAKFALRGLAQSLARELGPQGIHVAYLVIDGVIWSDRARDAFGPQRAQCLEPDALASTCAHLIAQDWSAWRQELGIRPDVEPF